MMNSNVLLDIIGIISMTALYLIDMFECIHVSSYTLLFFYALCCSLRILMDDLS